MKLLDAVQVKEEKTRAEQVRLVRVQKLNKEESDLALRVSEARSNAERTIAILDGMVAKHTQLSVFRKTELDADIAQREKMVLALEKRKSEALKPTDEIVRKAESLMAIAKRVEALNSEWSAVLVKDSKDHARIESNLRQQETEINALREDLGKRETRVINEEKRINAESKNLIVELISFREEVKKQSDSLNLREKELEDGKKANIDFHSQLIKESERLAQERRGIADTYKAIEQAKKHLGVV